MTELLLLGISHRVAPVALRERVALTERQAARLQTALCSERTISEAVAISTCNRTEIYVALEEREATEAEVLARLAAHAEIAPDELVEAIYSLHNCAAANRRLVSGPVVPVSRALSWARLTWPWISCSPTIIASRPAVTRKRWRAASQLRSV